MIVILYDGECGFCSATIQFILKRDRQGLFHFASIQSKAGRRLLRDHGVDEPGLDTMYLLEDGHLSERRPAALRIGTRLPRYGLLAARGRWVPRFLRDWCYRLVARNRYRLWNRESCLLPTEEQRARFHDRQD